MNYAQLGIDGNCGYALVGRDLQTGEAEFVEIVPTGNEKDDRRTAMRAALEKLRIRLGRPHLDEHPADFCERVGITLD